LEKTSLARIKIKFPEKIWISELFKSFPDARMEIQYFLPYDLENSIGNSIIEVTHYDLKNIINLIEDHESVLEFSILEQEDNRMKFNVKTHDPYLLYALIKCGVLVDFPVNVRQGNAYWRLIASRDRIDQLLTIFDDRKIDYELLRIGNSPYNLEDEVHKLTLEESNVLNEAINRGFFEIPREISLEDLANHLGKSKSALSVMLRKIIKKKVVIEK
jgi:predicted DNA binding protein